MTGTVTGWRFWGLREGGILTSPAGWGGAWEPGPNAAACHAPKAAFTAGLLPRSHGQIPDPDCVCGWRIMPALGELLAMEWTGFGWTGIKGLFGRPQPWLDVCGRVTLSGRVTGRDPHSDGPGVMRGELAEVTGPLFIPREFAIAAADLAARYSTDVVVAGVPQHEWMSGGLAADWAAYEAGVPCPALRPPVDASHKA